MQCHKVDALTEEVHIGVQTRTAHTVEDQCRSYQKVILGRAQQSTCAGVQDVPKAPKASKPVQAGQMGFVIILLLKSKLQQWLARRSLTSRPS